MKIKLISIVCLIKPLEQTIRQMLIGFKLGKNEALDISEKW